MAAARDENLNDKTLTKNPINQSVGRVLSGLRSARKFTSQEMADELGLSRAYYRLVEAGTVALPGSCAFQLANGFGLDLVAVTTIIGLVSILEELNPKHKKNRRKYSDAVGTVAERYVLDYRNTRNNLTNILPALSWVLDGLEPALKELEITADSRKADQKISEEYLSRLTGFLRTPVRLATGDQVDSSQSQRVLENSQPLYFDIAQGLLAQLADLPPHIAADGLARWENENERRFTRLRALTTDHRQFPISLDHWGWRYLWNEHRPHLEVIVCGDNAKDDEIAASMSAFQRGLAERRLRAIQETKASKKPKGAGKAPSTVSQQIVDDISNRVRYIIARGDEWRHAERLLWFDFKSREMPDPAVDLDELESDRSGRYRSFFNIWLYYLAPRIGSHVTDAANIVGFMDNHELTSSSSRRGTSLGFFYGVALSSRHIHACLKAFSKPFDDAARTP